MGDGRTGGEEEEGEAFWIRSIPLVFGPTSSSPVRPPPSVAPWRGGHVWRCRQSSGLPVSSCVLGGGVQYSILELTCEEKVSNVLLHQ